jgi:CRP-like cAMP-binding protein
MSNYGSLPVSTVGLQGVRLLAGLPDSVLREVAERCHFRRYLAGATVVARNDDDHAVYLLIKGRLRVVALSPTGREVSFRDLGDGECIGEIAAVDGGPRSATVIALDESVLARLAASDFLELLRLHWPICERVLAGLASTVRQLTDRVYELSTLSVNQRLASELLRLALATDSSATGRVKLSPVPRHAELAARVGTYREQVTRELAELTRLGIVSKQDDGLVVEDLERLSALVSGRRATG